VQPIITVCSVANLKDVKRFADGGEGNEIRAIFGLTAGEMMRVKELGAGLYGVVYRVPADLVSSKVRRGVKYVAVKLDKIDQPAWVKRFPRDLVLDVVRKTTIISFKAGEIGVGPIVYGAFPCIYGQHPVFVTIMEYLPWESWERWETRASTTQQKQAYKMLQHLMAKLAANNILHKDIHNENVMVSADAHGNAVDLRVIDYGLAQTVGEFAREDASEVDQQIVNNVMNRVIGHLVHDGTFRL
jgi:serine/threonine protein kinase